MSKDISGKVNCLKCRHFYITWDKNFPRGCRAHGFKSKHFPSQVVLSSSGVNCLYFQEKNTAKNSFY